MESTLIHAMLVLVVGAPLFGLAAQESAGQRLEIKRFHIKAEKIAEYEKVMKDWAAAARRAGLGPEYTWIISQEDAFTHWRFRPLDDFRHLDPRTEKYQQFEQRFREALGPERFQELATRTLPTLESVETWVAEQVPELSYIPENPPREQMHFAVLRIERVGIEKTGEYSRVLKEIGGVLPKADYPLRMDVYRTVTGNQNEYYVIFPARTREELKEYYQWMEKRLPEVAGKDAWNKLLTEWSATLLNFCFYEESQRYDLSCIPAAQ